MRQLLCSYSKWLVATYHPDRALGVCNTRVMSVPRVAGQGFAGHKASALVG